MNFLNNEKGVSEVIGALLIFLILVVVLGTIQVYEVPKWNKELERQHFDIVSAEFINLKSDLEDVSQKGIPKTGALHMGVKYPQRFMLRNPGPAYGTLNTYPVNISVNYTLENGETGNMSFQSNGIEYELNGLEKSPKLVNEHGIMIRDFGEKNISTDVTQSLLVGNEIFIPLVQRSAKSISSPETESINLEPIVSKELDTVRIYYGNETRLNISRINISMETKYPMIWKGLLGNNPNANVSGNKIKINITGTAGKYYVYPNTTGVSTGEAIYTGMIKYSAQMIGDTYIINQYGSGGGSGDLIIGLPPFTNIEKNMSNYPNIQRININQIGSDKTRSNITAYVYNVSNISQIHADLTDLTRSVNIWSFDVAPDTFDSNTKIATWMVVHPDYGTQYSVVATFWVKNNNMQFYTQRTFVRSGNNWNNVN